MDWVSILIYGISISVWFFIFGMDFAQRKYGKPLVKSLEVCLEDNKSLLAVIDKYKKIADKDIKTNQDLLCIVQKYNDLTKLESLTENSLWTVQVNDLIGGYIVTTYPYPLSQHQWKDENGSYLTYGYVIADVTKKEEGALIAKLLNLQSFKLLNDTNDKIKQLTIHKKVVEETKNSEDSEITY